MPRLQRPQNTDQEQLAPIREQLRLHAERRNAVRLHDGPLTKHFYKKGIPVKEIAEWYSVGQRTIYDIIKRQPSDCHPEGQDCTTCGNVMPECHECNDSVRAGHYCPACGLIRGEGIQ